MKKNQQKTGAGEAAARSMPEYRQFNSYGFLRVSRWDAGRSEYIQIGGFAGKGAADRANELIATDRTSRK